MALLTTIAHTEDAKRYAGPVTYYNQQLLPILGFAKWERLDHARKRLVESGWLYYECQGKRKPGIYWTLIPVEFAGVDDSPMDEGLCTLEGYRQGYNEGYKQGYKQGLMRGTEGDINRGQSGIQTGGNEGDNEGYPSILVPIPSPKPKRKAASPSFSVKEFPSDPIWMQDAEFVEVWRNWEKFRTEIKHGLTETMAAGQLKKLGKLKMEDAIGMIEHTIAMGWIGLRAPETNGQPKLTEAERLASRAPTLDDHYTPGQ